jgi:hypothetical protein
MTAALWWLPTALTPAKANTDVTRSACSLHWSPDTLAATTART